jgi:hypothetical protein
MPKFDSEVESLLKKVRTVTMEFKFSKGVLLLSYE